MPTTMSLLFLIALAITNVDASLHLRRVTFNSLAGLDRRQICTPVPAPATCERSCGPGNVPCITESTCYNPSVGESCCSDGKYCPADYYCTDAGCCPVGSSIDECGASMTLSTLPPPPATTSSEAATSSSVLEITSSTSSSASTTSSSSTSFEPTSLPSSTASIPTTTTAPTASGYPPTTYSASSSATVPVANGTYTNNTSATSTLPPQQTTNEGYRAAAGYMLYPLGLLGGYLAVV
ncbi:hypothetical protein LTR10_012107 [Elasticomyces elasticus]|nr:hypothetical protein LTR10_012107 [Elasticomyces elasticus]KAK4969048.1 hypothetical protein LTR42_009327 [Elasticomyces elasticus]